MYRLLTPTQCQAVQNTMYICLAATLASLDNLCYVDCAANAHPPPTFNRPRV